MIFIQKEFNAARGDVFRLQPGEYEGPLVIDRRCVVDGAGATILCPDGPVVTVSSQGVTLKNLRIEVTNEEKDPSSEIAINSSAPDTRLENVEVRGRVVGIPGESDAWELPSVINLGDFAADSSNAFLYTLQSPGNAVLKVNVNGLKVTPSSLRPGKNAILLTTDELRNNARLYGELMVVSAVSRRIYITGCAVKNAPRHTDILPADASARSAHSRFDVQVGQTAVCDGLQEHGRRHGSGLLLLRTERKRKGFGRQGPRFLREPKIRRSCRRRRL